VKFDHSCGRVSSVVIPKEAKQGEMIMIRVGNGTGKRAYAAAAGKVP
jgi:hypothetical protein